jgi:hypothetical protein
MRVIETIHPNLAMRTFTCDKVFTEKSIAYYDSQEQVSAKSTPAVVELFENLNNIPLAEEPSIRKYTISIGIVEAFENSEEDWNHIREATIKSIALFHGLKVSDLEITVKDDRKRYNEGEREYITLYGLQEKLMAAAIPHDFRTHRQTWRNALVIAKGLQEDFEKANGGESSGFWAHELKAFDAAFEALLSMKLPEK